MFPVFMAIINALRNKAASENQDLQNLQNNMQNAVQIPQQQSQIPTVGSVFGNR